ncbi:hypothetical protein RRF57_010677 [Xylaria bambusicola]|uniref:Protein kinase domain-containing protein n=1 Tax=Xylaria bambusicola TaxID=326684 RepID=A0AAN7ULL9_9PEZI
MTSTVVGKSGRVYIQGEVLQRREDPKLSIFKAESGNEPFVFKRVRSRPLYDLFLHLAAEFAGSRRLRMHIDRSQDEGILVYPYFTGTLLGLIQEDPHLRSAEKKKILQCVGEAIQELHAKDWVHIDIKPDNIFLNWTCDREGNKTITDVALGDFDIAFKIKDGKPLYGPHAIGNAMWRSPEGQTGRGVTKASDIYSFGLVCIYTFGGGELLLLNNYKELVKLGVTAEQEILLRHFMYFGPAPEGLLKQVDDEGWRNALKEISEIADKIVEEEPEKRFERWGEALGPMGQNMISGMINLDPAARATIDQVLAHPCWQEVWD